MRDWKFVSAVLTLLLWGVSAVPRADTFETPPTFKASEILDQVPETLSGEHFQVREEVQSDGYWDVYTIDTPFGVFHAHGWFDLRETIREINAIAYLQSLSRSRVFVEAVVDKGLEPIQFAAQIIQHPVQTVLNIPTGIADMFRRYARDAREVMETAGDVVTGAVFADEDDPVLAAACERGDEPYPGACDKDGLVQDVVDLAGRYFDVDDVKREYHQQLGTDPYSSNQVLQEAIARMSWIGGIGDFGMKKFGPSKRVKAVDVVTNVHRITWTKSPVELREYLAERMDASGVSAVERNYFLNNPYFTPSKQAFIVLALEEMDGVAGREHMLHWAADSHSESEALYSEATVALFVWYHDRYGGARFVPDTLLPVMETEDGDFISLHPIDHLSWTEDVATILRAAPLREFGRADRQRILWLLNRASDRAREEIVALGYSLVEDGYKDVVDSGEGLDLDPPVLDAE